MREKRVWPFNSTLSKTTCCMKLDSRTTCHAHAVLMPAQEEFAIPPACGPTCKDVSLVPWQQRHLVVYSGAVGAQRAGARPEAQQAAVPKGGQRPGRQVGER